MSIEKSSEAVKPEEPEFEPKDLLEEEFVLVGKDDEKVQRRRSFIVFGAILILVAVGSFGLGRLSSYEIQKKPTKIYMTDPAVPLQDSVLGVSSDDSAFLQKDLSEAPLSQSGEVVASKNSDKYHYPWCSGAKRISEENKMTFSSIEEAKKAGYKPASNCKGLK
jgi:hypothetical protein